MLAKRLILRIVNIHYANTRDITRLIDTLVWLNIPQRVQYKLAVAVHRCLRH